MVEIIFDENEDWEKRTLCGDEACIGTIGPDGNCKECGRTYEGELSAGGEKRSVEKAKIEKQNQVLSEVADSDDDWEKRVLCRDESCIGVIGPDGKCKECGNLHNN